MAGLGSGSPGLFTGLDGGLDAFDLGDSPLGDSSGLVEDLGGGLGTPDPSTAGASSTPGEKASGTAALGVSGTSSSTPLAVAVTASQQTDLFNSFPPQWTFQHTPPYDSPASGNSFGAVPPVPQQSWELPVHLNLNQPLLQQPPFQPQHRAASDPATTAANTPVNQAFTPIALLARPPNQRNIQNTLTPAQRERLKTIAMPPHLQYHSPNSADSPDSLSSGGHDKTTTSSPEGAELSKSNNSRKRKSSAEVEDDDDDDDLDGQQPVKKTAHNMIEKRYRTNLNDKIAALRDSVPSLRIMSKSARGEDTTEDREELHGLTPAHKLNKATVLSKATEYIRHLEKRNNRLIEENNSMQARIAAFEKLFMAGAITGQMPNPLQQQSPTPMPYAQGASPFLNTPMATPGASDPPGMIPIPEDMKRILAAQQRNAGRPYPVPAQQFAQNPTLLRQQQIQQQQQAQAQAQAGRWNPYFAKLMAGGVAGLMLVEALVEDEESSETTEGRGLFGLPAHLLAAFVRSTHFSIGGYYVSAIAMIAKLRLLLLVGFLVWLIFPSFLDTSIFRPSRKTNGATSAVKAVPSLASPIHVRRQAWLTAIQTVWVPRHNFFLEAAALLLKTLKYTLRNVVGSHGYLALTGLSEEQEAARVKAWSIALDAQLAGGDVEINRSRLTLTLIASGTLPDTPLRLMMKALHIRVLLWRLNGAAWIANLIATKMARSRWNEARQLNRILNSLPEGETAPDDALPEHLAALLERDCDEVLNDDIIQRAHNLAWNLHTTHNVADKVDGMDTVVEDAAVRSPMDAVAAWYSSLTLHRVLLSSLSGPLDDPADSRSAAADAIALANKVAPIGSNAQVRALVARAVLAGGRRGAHIVTALQALGPSLNPDKHPRYRSGVPPLIDSPMTTIVPDPDAVTALRCAMGIAQLRKFADPPPAARTVIDSVLPEPAAADDDGVEAMSLLGFVAAFRLMETLCRHPVGREACARALERLAGGLRIWMGCEAGGGDKAGLEEGLRGRMIRRCLAVAKSAVGMEADQGYGSMDECEGVAEGGGC